MLTWATLVGRAPVRAIPFWLAQIGVPDGAAAQRHAPPTVDQARLLTYPNVVGEAAGSPKGARWRASHCESHAMAGVVPAYLERFQPHGLPTTAVIVPIHHLVHERSLAAPQAVEVLEQCRSYASCAASRPLCGE